MKKIVGGLCVIVILWSVGVVANEAISSPDLSVGERNAEIYRYIKEIKKDAKSGSAYERNLNSLRAYQLFVYTFRELAREFGSTAWLSGLKSTVASWLGRTTTLKVFEDVRNAVALVQATTVSGDMKITRDQVDDRFKKELPDRFESWSYFLSNMAWRIESRYAELCLLNYHGARPASTTDWLRETEEFMKVCDARNFKDAVQEILETDTLDKLKAPLPMPNVIQKMAVQK